MDSSLLICMSTELLSLVLALAKTTSLIVSESSWGSKEKKVEKERKEKGDGDYEEEKEI